MPKTCKYNCICLMSGFISALAVQGRPDKTVPIKCYQCNSFYDKGCSDFFDNRTYPLIPCSWNATMCRKIIQESKYCTSATLVCQEQTIILFCHFDLCE